MPVADHAPVTDLVRAIEGGRPAVATSGFHSELHSIWGPPPPVLRQAGEFLSGVGEGFGQAVNEGAKAATQAIANPGEAIHKAVDETGKAVAGVLTGMEKAGEYIGDHAARSDWKGVVHDAEKTSHAIEHILSAGIEHVSKMNAHEVGKFVGHDVLPGAIVAVAAPELAGESVALAASGLSKVATIAKEGAALEKVAGVYESASAKIAAISEKMAGLNQKMEALHNGIKDSFTVGNRLRDGEIIQGERVSEHFLQTLKQATHDLTPFEKNALATAKLEHVHNMPESYLQNFIAKHGEKVGTMMAKEKYATQGTWQRFEDDIRVARIRIAEVTGLKGDAIPNQNIRHSLAHEIGHLIDDEMGGHAPLSMRDDFISLVKKDLIENKEQAENAMRLLGQLNGDRKRSEIWAELSAHVSAEALKLPVPQDELSQAIRKGFTNCFDHIKTINGNYSI